MDTTTQFDSHTHSQTKLNLITIPNKRSELTRVKNHVNVSHESEKCEASCQVQTNGSAMTNQLDH